MTVQPAWASGPVTAGSGPPVAQGPTGLVQTGLVPVPMRNATSASPIIPAGFTSSSVVSSVGDTSPLEPGGYVLSINAANPAGSVGLVVPFQGKRAGALIKADSTVGASFDVFVDDRLCVAADNNVLARGAIKSTLIDEFWALPIVEDLPDDGPHEMMFWLRGKTVGNVSLRIRALLLESRMGYSPPTAQLASIQPGGFVPATSTSIVRGSETAARQVRYRNEDTVTRTLTIFDSAGSTFAKHDFTAGEDWTIDIGAQTTDLAFLNHQADVAGKIRHWVHGVV